MLHTFIGWFGAMLFAVCAVPQAIKTWKTKTAGDLSWLFLLFWLFGEILTFVYIVWDDIIRQIAHWPLYLNYGLNIFLVLYLIYAKRVYKDNSRVSVL